MMTVTDPSGFSQSCLCAGSCATSPSAAVRFSSGANGSGRSDAGAGPSGDWTFPLSGEDVLVGAEGTVASELAEGTVATVRSLVGTRFPGDEAFGVGWAAAPPTCDNTDTGASAALDLSWTTSAVAVADTRTSPALRINRHIGRAIRLRVEGIAMASPPPCRSQPRQPRANTKPAGITGIFSAAKQTRMLDMDRSLHATPLVPTMDARRTPLVRTHRRP